MKTIIQTDEFFQNAEEFLKSVKEDNKTIILCQDGSVVAELIPPKDEYRTNPFSIFKDTLEIHGDIISPIDEKWNACC